MNEFNEYVRDCFSEADTAEVTEIANRLKDYKAHFATCHCTGLPVFNQMEEIMGDLLTYVRSGDEVRTLILTEKLVGAKDIVTL